MNLTLSSALSFFAALWLTADPGFSQSKPVAIGSSKARKGGKLKMRLASYPKSMNPFTASDGYGALIGRVVFCTLGRHDYETFELVPYVGKKWDLASDKLSIVFHIDERARWDDGTPVTSADLVYSYDMIFNKKHNTATQRSWLDAVKSWKALDKSRFQINFHRVHYENIERVGDLEILQKAYHEKHVKDFNKDLNHYITGCGPYEIDKKRSKKNRRIVVKRKPKWWGYQVDGMKVGMYNFDEITFKIIKEDRVGFEQYKKGDLSWFEFEAAGLDLWAKETKTAKFTKGPLKKLSFPMANPSSWAGIALNMRRDPTKDLKFRQALQFLFNAPLYVKKLYNNLYLPIKGPFGLFSESSSPKLSPPKPDPKKASSLLKELGYTQVDKDGVLFRTKNGTKQRAEITVMYSYLPHEKYLTIYKEEARKAGVQLNLKYVEWPTAMKQIDEWSFDAFLIQWSGGPTPSPSQLWMSKYADQKTSSNLPGFKNPEADRLTLEAAKEFDPEKRNQMYHRLEEIIVGEYPYVWRWAQSHHYFSYNEQLVAVPDKIFKYTGSARRDPPFIYWWDPKAK